MLVLTRRQGESLVIGDNHVTVTILDIHGERVKLSIDAPMEVKVMRKEVLTKERSQDRGDS
jgi:carbon storage regulator